MKSINSILGGIFAFLMSTICCWLPAIVIAIGGSTGLLGFSEELSKYKLLFRGISIVFLSYGAYRFYTQKIKKKEKTKSCCQTK